MEFTKYWKLNFMVEVLVHQHTYSIIMYYVLCIMLWLYPDSSSGLNLQERVPS